MRPSLSERSMPSRPRRKTDAATRLRQLKQLGRRYLVGRDPTSALERHFAQQAGGCAVTRIDGGLECLRAWAKSPAAIDLRPASKLSAADRPECGTATGVAGVVDGGATPGAWTAGGAAAGAGAAPGAAGVCSAGVAPAPRRSLSTRCQTADAMAPTTARPIRPFEGCQAGHGINPALYHFGRSELVGEPLKALPAPGPLR